MTLLLAFLSRAWPYILGAIALGIVYYQAQHWCNTACKDARQETVALQVEKQAAQDRARDIALLWAAQVDKTESEVKRATDERNTHFLGLMDRAQDLDRAPRIRISSAGVGLLLDASRLANAAGSAAVSETRPDPVSSSAISEADLAQSWTLAAQAYADALGQYRACINFYTSLQLVHNSP